MGRISRRRGVIKIVVVFLFYNGGRGMGMTRFYPHLGIVEDNKLKINRLGWGFVSPDGDFWGSMGILGEELEWAGGGRIFDGIGSGFATRGARDGMGHLG
jgi:hypothetical protein